MPIPLGVLAVAGAGAGPAPTPVANAYEWLETNILTGTQTSVTFSNLDTNYASTYQHLQLRITVRGSSAFNMTGRANGDTAGNYSWHFLEANGSSISAGSGHSGQTSINLGVGVAESNIFSAFIIDLLDPFETSKNLTTRSFYGASTAGTKWMGYTSGAWYNTNALTSFALAGGTFQIGSRFSLYGMKG